MMIFNTSLLSAVFCRFRAAVFCHSRLAVFCRSDRQFSATLNGNPPPVGEHAVQVAGARALPFDPAGALELTEDGPKLAILEADFPRKRLVLRATAAVLAGIELQAAV